VAAGAKDDTATITLQLPEIKPHMQAAPPIAALAYRPDGKLLAVGAHKAVMMVDLATDDVMGQFAAHPGRVTALAFSRDGRRLAVASSSPGTAGDVFLYALAKTVTENGAIALKTALKQNLSGMAPERVVQAHKDAILNLAFSPDGELLATT